MAPVSDVNKPKLYNNNNKEYFLYRNQGFIQMKGKIKGCMKTYAYVGHVFTLVLDICPQLQPVLRPLKGPDEDVWWPQPGPDAEVDNG